MALRITRAADPITVERLNLVLYAPPGIGKTSVAFTAEDPLLLDFDNGSHRAANRKDVVRVSDWSDVAGITGDDLAQFKTVIVDTAGRALDVLTVDIIRSNPKHGRGGALTLQGYGELKSRFVSFLKLLNGFGKDVVLVAHMDEQRNGDDIIERLDVQGGSKGEIYKAADAMGRMVIDNGQRWLRFSPTDAAFGKNPGQLEPLAVPHHTAPEFDGFLAGVIQQTKDRLNALSEDQKAAMAEQAWFRDALPKVENADGINALMGRAKAAGEVCKGLLHKRATEIGLAYDKATGAYAAQVKRGGSVMLARVSNIEAFRRWRDWKPRFDGDEEPSIDDLVRWIVTDEPNEAMMAGTAFHAALETAEVGEHDSLSAMGYAFQFAGGSLALPTIRELRAFRDYGDLTVTGKADCIAGRTIIDHKSTGKFDADRYLEGCQWRFYLELFGADEFRWNIFVLKETDPKVYRVAEPQVLTVYRYPGIARDCEALAADYLEFAREHLPDGFDPIAEERAA